MARNGRIGLVVFGPL